MTLRSTVRLLLEACLFFNLRLIVRSCAPALGPPDNVALLSIVRLCSHTVALDSVTLARSMLDSVW